MVPERNHEERLIHVFPCGFLTIMNNSLLSTTQKVSKLSSRLPDIPFCDSLKIITLCHTLSKALGISRKTLLTSSPSCMMDNS